MPVYEFRCQSCGTSFEALVRGSGAVVACPSCGGALLEKKLSVPAPVRSGGRREAGHTCCGRDERCARPPCSDGGRCHRG